MVCDFWSVLRASHVCLDVKHQAGTDTLAVSFSVSFILPCDKSAAGRRHRRTCEDKHLVL